MSQPGIPGECFTAGPYVLHVKPDRAQIIWVSPPGTSAGTVSWEVEGQTGSSSTTAHLTNPRFQSRDFETWDGSSSDTHSIELDYVRNLAEVNGLPSYARVHYRVTCGDRQTVRSGTFRSVPEPGAQQPFRFIAVSDGHADSGRYDQVPPAVGAEKADFVIHTGDLTGGRGTDWHRWMPYFQVARPYHESGVLVPVVGGHDASISARNFRAFFGFNEPNSNPADEDHTGTWYTKTYGNAEFFFIDHVYDVAYQVGWIEERLSESSAEWKIVALHQSEANAGGRGNLFRGHYDNFAQLFEDYGVDLVISGHDHIYERNLPIGPPGSSPVHYISINSGGNFREIRPSPIVIGGMGQWERMYAHFLIEGNRLEMIAKNTEGDILDRMELIKDRDGNYQPEIMAQAVERELAIELAHIYTGNIDGDLRYSRRDINARFESYPQDDQPLVMTLNTHRFPPGSELIVYEQDDPDGWRTAYQEIKITGDVARVEVIAPAGYGTVGRSWSIHRGTVVARPIPEFLINVRIDGRKFEPARIQPSFGVALESRP